MKTVLVDFSHYADLCGFGDIARHYAAELSRRTFPDLHFIVILPRQYRGTLGDQFTYIDREDKRRQLKQLDRHIDLWHATDQLYHLRGGDKDTVQLLTVHDANFLTEKTGIHRLRHIVQLKWRVWRSDHITVISQFVLNDLRSHGLLMGRPVSVIYNGIGEDPDAPAKQPAFVTSEPFFFTIGQIRKKKNFHTLIPMMRHFPSHRLYICGDDHFAYADTLRRLIAQEGGGRVVLTGKISDEEKRWLYNHADAFLFPSRLEGFGLPVLEAMRHRCKVFSSALSSLPEVCNGHASLWDDFEPDHMARTVKQGLEAWDRQGEAATAAFVHAMTFSYDTYADQYIALYRRLLNLD